MSASESNGTVKNSKNYVRFIGLYWTHFHVFLSRQEIKEKEVSLYLRCTNFGLVYLTPTVTITENQICARKF